MTSGGGGVVEDAAPGVAPFVAKTYRMVDDPGTDGIIAWGADSNTFVVADPFVFSRTLLPVHFKHSNLSSFVRQLNTYGFRKVDPDRWEFAHVSFLRGQTHLLRHVVRRSGKRKDDGDGKADEDDGVAVEVARLKREQRAIEDRVAAMRRRVQETERRPKQMLAFLVKVAGDPQVLRRRLLDSSGGDGSGGFASSGPADGGVEAIRLKRRQVDDGLYGAGAGEDAVDLAGFFGAGEGVAFPPPPYAFPVDSTSGY